MFSFMAEPAPWPYLELTLLRHMAAGLVVEEIAGETVHARTSEGNAVLVDRCHYDRAKARFDRGDRAPTQSPQVSYNVSSKAAPTQAPKKHSPHSVPPNPQRPSKRQPAS